MLLVASTPGEDHEDYRAAAAQGNMTWIDMILARTGREDEPDPPNVIF